jgi:uncharacterized membrane protein YeiH
LILIDIIGIIAFAISGYIIAREHNLDLLGMFLISFSTALGGGIIRDTISDRVPFTFTECYPFIVVIIVISISYTFKIAKSSENTKIFLLADNLGLVAFAITGAITGVESNMNFIGVVLLSLITAIGGGVIRDILLNRVPTVLSSDFYGSVAVIIGVSIYILEYFGLRNDTSTNILFICGIIIRIMAIKWEWKLPTIKY